MRNPIDEELLSGYLDGSLSQRDHQRVRLLLEENADAQRVFGELRLLREAARSTRFHAPPEPEWPELPQTPISRFGRGLGFALLIAWVLLATALAMRFLFERASLLEALLWAGLPAGFLALLISIGVDRYRELDHDRYRGVQR